MAVLSTILNLVLCGINDLLGAGLQGCDFDFGNVKQVRIQKKGFTIPADADYNKAYLRQAQQDGNIVMVLDGVYDFTWNTGEDSTEDAESTGLSSVTRKGIYAVSFKFRKGLYHQKVLNSLDGGNFDVVLVDESGNELFTQTSTGGVKGFSTSMIAVDPIMFANGTTSQKTGVRMQFSNSTQFNKSLAWNSAEQLDFVYDEITGANQVAVSVPTAPSNSDTTVVVKTVLARGGSFVGGLTAANFLVKVNGAGAAPTAAVADSSAGTYTLTIPTLSTSDKVEVSLYDSAANSSIVIVNPSADDVLYKSNTATTVVA